MNLIYTVLIRSDVLLKKIMGIRLISCSNYHMVGTKKTHS
jgi:hypothetical protein